MSDVFPPPKRLIYLVRKHRVVWLARAYSHFHNVCTTYNAESSCTNKRWVLTSTRTQKPHQIQPYKYTHIHICIVYALMYYIFGTLNSLTTGTPLICRRRRTQNTNRQRDSAPAQLNARDIARLHIQHSRVFLRLCPHPSAFWARLADMAWIWRHRPR